MAKGIDQESIANTPINSFKESSQKTSLHTPQNTPLGTAAQTNMTMPLSTTISTPQKRLLEKTAMKQHASLKESSLPFTPVTHKKQATLKKQAKKKKPEISRFFEAINTSLFEDFQEPVLDVTLVPRETELDFTSPMEEIFSYTSEDRLEEIEDNIDFNDLHAPFIESSEPFLSERERSKVIALEAQLAKMENHGDSTKTQNSEEKSLEDKSLEGNSTGAESTDEAKKLIKELPCLAIIADSADPSIDKEQLNKAMGNFATDFIKEKESQYTTVSTLIDKSIGTQSSVEIPTVDIANTIELAREPHYDEDAIILDFRVFAKFSRAFETRKDKDAYMDRVLANALASSHSSDTYKSEDGIFFPQSAGYSRRSYGRRRSMAGNGRMSQDITKALQSITIPSDNFTHVPLREIDFSDVSCGVTMQNTYNTDNNFPHPSSYTSAYNTYDTMDTSCLRTNFGIQNAALDLVSLEYDYLSEKTKETVEIKAPITKDFVEKAPLETAAYKKHSSTMPKYSSFAEFEKAMAMKEAKNKERDAHKVDSDGFYLQNLEETDSFDTVLSNHVQKVDAHIDTIDFIDPLLDVAQDHFTPDLFSIDQVFKVETIYATSFDEDDEEEDNIVIVPSTFFELYAKTEILLEDTVMWDSIHETFEARYQVCAQSETKSITENYGALVHEHEGIASTLSTALPSETVRPSLSESLTAEEMLLGNRLAEVIEPVDLSVSNDTMASTKSTTLPIHKLPEPILPDSLNTKKEGEKRTKNEANQEAVQEPPKNNLPQSDSLIKELSKTTLHERVSTQEKCEEQETVQDYGHADGQSSVNMFDIKKPALDNAIQSFNILKSFDSMCILSPELVDLAHHDKYFNDSISHTDNIILFEDFNIDTDLIDLTGALGTNYTFEIACENDGLIICIKNEKGKFVQCLPVALKNPQEQYNGMPLHAVFSAMQEQIKAFDMSQYSILSNSLKSGQDWFTSATEFEM